ncbi:uncharacterized protein [Cicer arietinum]|uniref:Heavy metal-associated isoprenylated plant protein 28-like n=1 Tax=Cicer arietinum TaxID=3827 RepID=A0A3Q7XVY7_CICAR|nr:heavy metal-associated isoprenylated plant protein 28-like [Cicer arietinum]
MEDNIEFSISTLKVDLGCTKGCPTDVTNMLQQLKGVKSISIDPNQGNVTVVGNVNPMMLIKILQKMGKKAQLWSFDKKPKKKSVGSHHRQKHHSHCCHESSNIEDESETVHYDRIKHRTHHYERSKTKHDQDNMFGFGNQHQHAPQSQPQVSGYHPPMSGPNYQQQFSGYNNHHPTMSWNQPQHVTFPRPPSMYPISRPPYGYYGQGHPSWPNYGQGQPAWPTNEHYGSRLPGYNPMIHYNSYADNYRYTM